MENAQTKSSILGSFSRKLKKSLKQRGLFETAKRCVARPFLYGMSYLNELSPAVRKRRKSDMAFDRNHNVDTIAEFNPGWMAEVESPNWEFGRGYFPAPIDSLKHTLGNLEIDYPKYTFIDFGSGKGRSVLIAAEQPFKKGIGVEYSRYLSDVAARNFETYKNDEQQCFELEAVCQDAAGYDLPNEPLVIYFYDPFAEPLMRQVVDRIKASYEAHPRPMHIVYYNPVFAEMFEESEIWKRETVGEQFDAYWNRTKQGNKEANEFASDRLDGERFVVYKSSQ